MERDSSISLNEISKQAAFTLIEHFINQGVKLTCVYIDTVGKEDKYQKVFENKFGHLGIKFVVRSKADSLFPVVSAASICAKVDRDFILENWNFEEDLEIDRDFGCGYPGDKDAQMWLKRNLHSVFGFPSLVRFSWQTVKTL